MRGKRTGPSVWILRGALATLGLAGAGYAADQATAPPAPADVGATIAVVYARDASKPRHALLRAFIVLISYRIGLAEAAGARNRSARPSLLVFSRITCAQ